MWLVIVIVSSLGLDILALIGPFAVAKELFCDAYAEAATVSIKANVAEHVSDIEVGDNELVHQGATIFGSWRELTNEESRIGRL
jgi:multidrug resistance efflux pump